MPALTVTDPLVLPRITGPAATSVARPVATVAGSHHALEGAGFPVARPFPGNVSWSATDPFILLDHIGPSVNGPGESAGAPWHPHRGFETVTYVLDGEVAHHDSNGGGGVIGEGDTQWMTAGAGILHDELPTERLYRQGGAMHAVQLWVNLPGELKMTPPRYQAITAPDLTLLTTHDGGALLRVIAGSVDGHAGPGSTYTPITYAHATVAPGAELAVPWTPDYSAMAFVLTGSGHAGPAGHPIGQDDLVVFGPGDHVQLRAGTAGGEHPALDVLLLGGRPLREPMIQYGPFVMSTRAQIIEAMKDFQAGRLGVIPAGELGDRRYA
ncbi:MAG: pirin family protein [Acidimicrobiia bacterium]|nr:pirin family protein [Acidimicrobiia bacterium]